MMKMNGTNFKSAAFAVLILLCVLTGGFAVQTPKISSIELTDNGLLVPFVTGNVHRGTLFTHTSGGSYYGQFLSTTMTGNESGACTTFNNITLNVTLRYENLPAVLSWAQRFNAPICLNSTPPITGGISGTLMGGGVFALAVSQSDRPAIPTCAFNYLDRDPDFNNYSLGTACNSSGLSNLPDGSVILNLLLWDYNSGALYDNQTYYFIEGCETGCVGRPTAKVLNLNPYFTSDIANWRGTISVGGLWQWFASSTDPSFKTRTGISNYTSKPTGLGHALSMYSMPFTANRTDVSMFLGAEYFTHLDRAGGAANWDLTLRPENSNATTIATLFALVTPDGVSNWTQVGVRVPASSLASNGLPFTYKFFSGTSDTSATNIFSTNLNYLKAVQYTPSIQYLLSTTASNPFATSILNTAYSFSQCTEFSTNYVCLTTVNYANGTLYTSIGHEVQTCVAGGTINGSDILTTTPDGQYSISTGCFVFPNTQYTTPDYISNTVNVTVSASGVIPNGMNVTFLNPPSDGYQYPLAFNVTNQFTPQINVQGCSACSAFGSFQCAYNTYVDSNKQSTGAFAGDGAHTLASIYTRSDNPLLIAISPNGSHTVKVEVGCYDVSANCTLFGQCSQLGTNANPVLGAAITNFVTGNYTSLKFTLDDTNLTFLPNPLNANHADLLLNAYSSPDNICTGTTHYQFYLDSLPIQTLFGGYDLTASNVFTKQVESGYVFSKGTHYLEAIGTCGTSSYGVTSLRQQFSVTSNSTALQTTLFAPTANQTINTSKFNVLFNQKGCATTCASGLCEYFLQSDGFTDRTGLIQDGNFSAQLTTPIGVGYHSVGILADCPDDKSKRSSSAVIYWGGLSINSTPTTIPNLHLQSEVIGGKLDTTNRDFYLDSTGAFNIEPLWYNLNRKAELRLNSDVDGTCQIVRDGVRVFRTKPMALAKIKEIVAESVTNYENTLKGYNCTDSILGGTTCQNSNGTVIVDEQKLSVWTQIWLAFKLAFSGAFTKSGTPTVQVVNNTPVEVNTTYYFDPSTPFQTNEVVFSLDSNTLANSLSDFSVKAQTVACNGINTSFIGTSVDKLLHPAYSICFHNDYEQKDWGNTVIATVNVPANRWSVWKIDDQLLTQDVQARLQANQIEMTEPGQSKTHLDESDFQTHVYTTVSCNFNGMTETQDYHFVTTTHNYAPRPFFSLGMLFVLAWLTPLIITLVLILQNARGGNQGGQQGG